jgi:site-specific recombinase XerD
MVKMKKKLPVVVSTEEFPKLIKHTKKPSDKIFLVRQGKGGKDRIVPLPKGFRESHLKHVPTKVGVRQLQRSFKNASERAGLLKTKPTLHFHSLRHGFGTRCVSEGMPIHHLRTLMGHTNISTTNVYLEANPKEALKSYEDLF